MSVELARRLAFVAEHLERQGYAYAGVVRQGARALLTAPPRADRGCRGCGVELVQQATGRPRVWCSERCRRRHRP